ncbi:MAG: LPS assembly lipoprotein LptE [Burkholderiales bacterium]
MRERLPIEHVPGANGRGSEDGAFACARMLFMLSLMATLAGCGFHLRGAVQLPFPNLYVNVSNVSQFGHELKRALRASDVRLMDNAKEAAATLSILSELRERHILSLGGQGRVREYQLRYRLAYQVTNAKGVITPPTEIVLKRDISFNDSEVLAKESEEALLYRDMQLDAVQQLLRRLEATKVAGG